jgi:dTDP-4-amino-4,6-dideoxygalactose transaminase
LGHGSARYRERVIQVPLNDLSRIDNSLRSSIVDDLESILRRGTFFRGRFTTEFEAAMSSRFGGRSAACVGNGTDALYLALAALAVGAGDRIATVSNAGGYSTNAILRCGASPVFVDIDPITAQMDPAALSQLLVSDGTIRAVVATHLYGLVGEISTIRETCDEFGVSLIEDCAQSFGARSGASAAGTFGDLATFSFYPTKNLGAYGDAGAVVSSTAELDQRVRSLAQYGWSARYDITIPGGVNSRIDEIQAAILLRGLELVDDQNRRRRQIAIRYRDALADGRRLIAADDDTFVAHLAVMVTESRDADATALDQAGVGTGVHYPIADHRQAAWRDICEGARLPFTDDLQRQILTLPCFPTMTDPEVDHVIGALAALPSR